MCQLGIVMLFSWFQDFGLDWNISGAAVVPGAQSTKPIVREEPPTFPLAPAAGQIFHLSSELTLKIY